VATPFQEEGGTYNFNEIWLHGYPPKRFDGHSDTFKTASMCVRIIPYFAAGCTSRTSKNRLGVETLKPSF
jgi:hypothetical protein